MSYINRIRAIWIALIPLALLGLTACGGASEAEEATTTAAATKAPTTEAPTTTEPPTTTEAPTTTVPTASAGDVRACTGLEQAVDTAIDAQQTWFTEGVSLGDYDELAVGLSEAATEAADNADSPDLARALLDLQAHLEDRPNSADALESDAAYDQFMVTASDHLSLTINVDTAAVRLACVALGEQILIDRFMPFTVG